MDLDQPDTLTLIDLPGVDITTPSAINAAGTIVGSYRQDFLSAALHGFLRDAKGNFASIDVAGATSTALTGINARGTIVGYYHDTERTVSIALWSSEGRHFLSAFDRFFRIGTSPNAIVTHAVPACVVHAC